MAPSHDGCFLGQNCRRVSAAPPVPGPSLAAEQGLLAQVTRQRMSLSDPIRVNCDF